MCSYTTGSQIVLRTSAREIISTTWENLGLPDKGLSQEDIQFLGNMQEGIVFKDGHYEMPLPLRNPMLQFSNNKVIAQQRLEALTKRLQRDPEYREKYLYLLAFMSDLFHKHYAEVVPEQELGQDVTACYLPHHGVSNPAKPNKLRVDARSYKHISGGAV